MTAIKKYNIPSNLVNEEMGTIYIVENEKGKRPSLYVQVSEEDEQPQWERLGDVLETIYGDIACKDIRFLLDTIQDYKEILKKIEREKNED